MATRRFGLNSCHEQQNCRNFCTTVQKYGMSFQEMATEIMYVFTLLASLYMLDDLSCSQNGFMSGKFTDLVISLYEAGKKVKYASKKYRQVNPDKLVSKEEFENKIKEAFKEQDGYITVVTPETDTAIIEGLLDISPGTLGEGRMEFAIGAESCRKCGRHYSFLDTVHTAFTIHDKQFMKDVLIGKYGCILTHPPPQVHRCYGCNTPAPCRVVIYGFCCYGCG